MGFWNNVWIALTTPNEKLAKICLTPMSIIESALSFYLIINVFKLEYTKKQKILYIVVLSSICSIVSLFVPFPYNTILQYIVAFFLVFYIFKMSIMKTIISTVFPSIIFNLVGYLITKPYTSILNVKYELATSVPIYRIPCAIIIYFFVYLLILIIKYKKITIDIIESLDKKNKIIVVINLVLGILNIFFQGLIINKYTDILPFGFVILNFVFLLSYFGLSFYSLIKVMTLYSTEKKLESAEEYNKTLHILHDSVRGFKHDFDNIITTIGGYIQTNDMAGLKNYYSQLEADCAKVNNLYVLNPDIINNPGIYNLLTSKYNEAIQKGIKVNLSFLLDLHELHMKVYEFARILGILLDNAIDAASETNNKKLNISFRNDSRNSRNIVLIENTYNDKYVDIEKIFEKGVSGKENHTGLGLWEIKQILKKNNNVNLHTSKNKEMFSQQLEIYY